MKLLIQNIHQRMLNNFTYLDFGFLKLYGAIFGLMVGAYYPEIIKTYLPFFVFTFLMLMVRFFYLLFFKMKQ